VESRARLGVRYTSQSLGVYSSHCILMYLSDPSPYGISSRSRRFQRHDLLNCPSTSSSCRTKSNCQNAQRHMPQHLRHSRCPEEQGTPKPCPSALSSSTFALEASVQSSVHQVHSLKDTKNKKHTGFSNPPKIIWECNFHALGIGHRS